MPLHSSIATYYTDALPYATDEQGQPTGRFLTGHVRVTHPDHPLPTDAEHPKERHVFHIEPGRQPEGTPATVTVLGSETPWTPDGIRDAHPDDAPYVLEATWEEQDPETGETVVRRGKEVQVPDGVTPLETGLVPHLWAGEVV